MITEIFDSEYKVYYLALATAVVAAIMSLIFLIFKSVATLMMMMSSILIMIVAIIILGAAIYIDFNEGRFKPTDYHNSDH